MHPQPGKHSDGGHREDLRGRGASDAAEEAGSSGKKISFFYKTCLRNNALDAGNRLAAAKNRDGEPTIAAAATSAAGKV